MVDSVSRSVWWVDSNASICPSGGSSPAAARLASAVSTAGWPVRGIPPLSSSALVPSAFVPSALVPSALVVSGVASAARLVGAFLATVFATVFLAAVFLAGLAFFVVPAAVPPAVVPRAAVPRAAVPPFAVPPAVAAGGAAGSALPGTVFLATFLGGRRRGPRLAELVLQLADASGQVGDLVGGGQAHPAQRPIQLDADQLRQGLPVGGAGLPQVLREPLELLGGGATPAQQPLDGLGRLLPRRVGHAERHLRVRPPCLLAHAAFSFVANPKAPHQRR